MSYLVLARKYRPRSFADVVGQAPVVRALSNALASERLHHAYLFTGTRGVGKTTLARILASCFNCEQGVTATPCGECAACEQIAAGRFMDLIEVDAASRTGVDDTRELLTNAQYLPGQGRFKVYLIDEVHMLTGHSFNALLKTLEEPPEHVKFLLATTEAKKIPVTVLSRCLQFNLKNILPEVIESQLAKVLAAESIEAEPAALATIARAAKGSMRDALSIADQAVSHGAGAIAAASVQDMLGVAGRDEVAALLEALAAGDSAALLAAADDLANRSMDLAAVLGELQAAFHDLAVAAELKAEPAAPYQRFRERFAAEDLQLYYQIALMGGRDMTLAPDPKIGFDMTLIRLASFEPQALEPQAPEPKAAAPRAATRPASKPQPASAPAVEPAPDSGPSASAAPPPAGNGAAPAHEEAPADPPAEVPPPTTKPEPAAERAADAEALPPAGPAVDDGGEWHAIVDAIRPASGVTAMILDHSNLQQRTAEQWVVLVEETHASLLNDTRRQEIADLASAHEGRTVKVAFQLGKPAAEMPGERRRRQQEQRRGEAEAVLRQDANVKALLTEFDGRLASAQLREAAP